MQKIARLISSGAVMLLLSGISMASAACLPWDQARSVIKQHGLINAGEIRQISQRHGTGKIIDLRLCDLGGRYAYQVGILEPGKVKRVILDARNGKTIYVGVPGANRKSSYAGTNSYPRKELKKLRPKFRRLVPQKFRKRFKRY